MKIGAGHPAVVAIGIAALTAAWMLVTCVPLATRSSGEMPAWAWSTADGSFAASPTSAVQSRDESLALYVRLDARSSRGSLAGGASPSAATPGPDGPASAWPPLIEDAERSSTVVRLPPGAPTPTPTPEYYTVVGGDTLFDIADTLGVSAVHLAEMNRLGDGEMLAVGQRLVVPPRPNAVHRVVRPSRAATLIPKFIWPVGGDISTYFGEPGAVWIGGKHSGLDIAAKDGIPIAAAAGGKVLEAGWSTSRGYGNYVLIDHGMGIRTIYGHMSEIVAKAGDSVDRGDLIGYVGNTGISFGPHLHFEVQIEGSATDPLTYLP